MIRSAALVLATLAAGLSVTAAQAHAALRAPALESPADRSSGDLVPTFAWKAVRGAMHYEVAIAADQAFGSLVSGKTIRTRNTAATLEASVADGLYFWRVRAITKAGNAGRWSSPRVYEKKWASAPLLLGPQDDVSVVWPQAPLVLSWAPVARATKYEVVVATDPALANVVSNGGRPAVTQGTQLALPHALAPGRYFWAVTPIDNGSFKGRRSRVGTFSWQWPSATALRWEDIAPEEAIVDPVLHWDPVAGAAAYEVEINPTAEFTPGSLVLSAKTMNTSLAPQNVVDNNTYHWRVRALDPNGHAGEWNVGTFVRRYVPRVENVRLFDTGQEVRAGSTSRRPSLAWDPVAGASAYRLQIAEWNGTGCTWYHNTTVSLTTPNPAWAPGSGPTRSFDATHPRPTRLYQPFVDGRQYSVRVAALGGDDLSSVWTEHKPMLTFAALSAPEAPCSTRTAAAAYAAPADGRVLTTTPVFRWAPAAGVSAYWVVVAKDPQFTQVVDVALAHGNVYAPPKTYADETTAYYWAAIPHHVSGCISLPEENAPRAFEKRSAPPGLTSPGWGHVMTGLPVLRWTRTEGAATYKVQVDDDASFASPIETVTTPATAYATSAYYPADTSLHWRVRAIDVKGVELNWSTAGMFRRTLPTPSIAPGNSLGGETIPVLSWQPTEGATAYDMHVDQADGTAREFRAVASAFTPTLFYGTGVWRWRVRARFPASRRQSVTGAWSAEQTFVRRIEAPSRPAMVHRKDRLVFSWLPDAAASKYRIEVSSDTGFSSIIDKTVTPNTSWAPTLDRSGYDDGGRLFWRLAKVDDGGNVGAYATGRLAMPKGLRINVRGLLRRGRASHVVVQVLDAKSKPVRKVAVRVSGAGVRTVRSKTAKRGMVRFRLRPRKRGMLKLTATLKGYRTATQTHAIR